MKVTSGDNTWSLKTRTVMIKWRYSFMEGGCGTAGFSLKEVN